MKLVRWLVIICVVLLLVYGASPYFSFWRFTAAVRSRDAAAISARVDFPAVRASLKRQLVARFAKQTSSHKRWSNLGPTLIDAIIDAYITPEGIAALLSNPETLKNLKAPREFHFELGKNEDLSKVKYAFFTGPRSFVVDRDGIKLSVPFHSLRLAASRSRPRFDRREALISDIDRRTSLSICAGASYSRLNSRARFESTPCFAQRSAKVSNPCFSRLPKPNRRCSL